MIELKWEGKENCINEYKSKCNKTLIPCVDESVNFNKTENMYIEGDNIDALKLLKTDFENKIKVIYIDPPYNTGRDLIYKNNFKKKNDFHSFWLSMMYPRLKLARDLLTDDGVIFISIDDNELYNLKLICDEIFGEENFIGTIVIRSNPQGRNKANIDPIHEYHLVFSKNKKHLPRLKINQNNLNKFKNLLRSGKNSRKCERPLRFFPLLIDKNNKIKTITDREYFNIYLKNNSFDDNYINFLKNKYEKLGYTFILPTSKNGEYRVWQRRFCRVQNECHNYKFIKGQVKIPINNFKTPQSLWTETKYSNVLFGSILLKKLFNDVIIFDYSKSLYTVKDLISLISKENDFVLDFFSGSSTTAHAVMQLNAEDGGNRRYIMVQLPEPLNEKTEAFQSGYRTICDIGKERIKRIGSKIKNENPNVDIGFKCFKVV